ncbi:MAG: Flp pilus assembly protein CpaB [Hyphomicrobiales bacterium]|nr:MAG: Flp pilus assembly protein CpaB [Hyphomicrobiales bacterium]
MNLARIVILVIALVAAGAAAMLVSNMGQEPQQVVQAPVKQIKTVDVLVSATDISLGNVVAAGDISWQPWPEDAVQPHYITRVSQPDAIKKIAGSTARSEMFRGEPVNENKLVKADGGGFMSAILPSGMRAVSTPISAETGAGGFILPNDRVDVLLTRRVADPRGSGKEQHSSETVMSNIRVLAIDQAIKEENGKKVVVGRTATLEVRPRQAELLALANSMGNLSLSLRSLQDTLPGGLEDGQRGLGDGAVSGKITVLRFGVASNVTNTH